MKVTIRWWDAKGSISWMSVEEAKAETCAPCETVGWLLEQNSEYLVIAHTKSDEQVYGVFTIPASCVTEIET